MTLSICRRTAAGSAPGCKEDGDVGRGRIRQVLQQCLAIHDDKAALRGVVVIDAHDLECDFAAAESQADGVAAMHMCLLENGSLTTT